MTKKDRNSILAGIGISAGLFALAWFWRQKKAIPVLLPTQVKFENE